MSSAWPEDRARFALFPCSGLSLSIKPPGRTSCIGRGTQCKVKMQSSCLVKNL